MSILHVSEDRSASKRKNVSDTVVCTACYQRIDAYRVDWLKKHPVLSVLICKRCLMKHEVPIQRGDDGMDEACRWCALEGDLICCDFCHNVFCNECIRRNLGRKHLSIILNAGPEQKWQCYVCNPEPIQGLITMCENTLRDADLTTDDLEDLGDDEEDAVDDSLIGENTTPKKRKYTKRQPKVVPIEQLTYEALVEKKGGKEEEAKGSQEKATEEAATAATEATAAEAAANEAPESEAAATTTAKSDKDFLYIETSDGKVVAMNRSDVIKVDTPTVFKRPKGRPRLSGKTPPSSLHHKKYPQASEVHKNSPSSLEALASVKLHEKIPLLVSGNAWNVVEKLTASIQSMCMLLSSLKDDLIRTEVLCTKEEGVRNPVLRKKRRELAANFWRAYLAYKKSFVDIETFSRSQQSIASNDPKNTALDASVNEEEEEEEDRVEKLNGTGDNAEAVYQQQQQQS